MKGRRADYWLAQTTGRGKSQAQTTKKKAVEALQAEHGYSQRRACRLNQCNRNTARHISKHVDDPTLRARLKELAQEQNWHKRRKAGIIGCYEASCVWKAGFSTTSELPNLQTGKARLAAHAPQTAQNRRSAIERNLPISEV